MAEYIKRNIDTQLTKLPCKVSQVKYKAKKGGSQRFGSPLWVLNNSLLILKKLEYTILRQSSDP